MFAHWRCEGCCGRRWELGEFGLIVEGVGSLGSEKADEKSVGCEKIGCPKLVCANNACPVNLRQPSVTTFKQSCSNCLKTMQCSESNETTHMIRMK